MKNININESKAYDIAINKNSEDTTYVLSDFDENLAFNLKCDEQANLYAVKDGDDLVFVTKILGENKVLKTVKTIIQNYFTYEDEDFSVKYSNLNNELVWDRSDADNRIVYLQDSAILDYIYLNGGYVSGNKKSDIYWFDNEDSLATIYDEAGDDKYYPANKTQSIIYDYSGKDTYNIDPNSKCYITDFLGNDKYQVVYYGRTLDENNDINIIDYNGNDLYISRHGVYYNVSDFSGNDTYEFIDAETGADVNDEKGNDNYKIVNASGKVTITDKSGKDKYVVSNADDITISDYYSKGKDSYELYNSNSTVKDLDGDDKYKVIGGITNITDDKGKETYSLSGTTSANITDGLGNDKYNVSTSNNVVITDNSGKDTYNFNYVSGTSYLEPSKILDLSGNDKYNIRNSFYIRGTDETGNDTYKLNEVYTSILLDKDGKDTYNISNSSDLMIYNLGNYSDKYIAKDSISVQILDGIFYEGETELFSSGDKSNDTYSLSNIVDIFVKDYGGKDAYKASNIDDVTIVDYGEYEKVGDNYKLLADKNNNDKYTVKNIYEHAGIFDMGGKDYYNIKSSKFSINDFDEQVYRETVVTDEFGNETTNIYEEYKGGDNDIYKIVKCSESNIYDYGGDDKYNVTSSHLNIRDEGGNDKYTFKNTQGRINESNGNDKYTISSSKNIHIGDEEGDDKYTLSKAQGHIYDSHGNDTYILSKTQGGIYESGGNDKYVINSLKGQKVYINDEGGEDSFVLKNVNKKNLICLANYTSSSYSDRVSGGGIVLLDKSNNGFVYIDDFFATKSLEHTTLDFENTGNGYMETFKLGKSNLSNFVTNSISANYDRLGEEVASWLADTSQHDYYSNVVNLLQNGSDADIKSFVSFVNKV